MSDDYDLENALTELGTGEAIVTILSEKGAPTPVVWTKILPPVSLLGAVDPAEVKAAGEASPLYPTYAQEIDRESATELLAAKMGVPVPAASTTPTPPTGPPSVTPKPAGEAPDVRKQTTGGKGGKGGGKADDGGAVTDYLKSREGRSMLNTIARGVFGLLKK
jgi:hypothetical protein